MKRPYKVVTTTIDKLEYTLNEHEPVYDVEKIYKDKDTYTIILKKYA